MELEAAEAAAEEAGKKIAAADARAQAAEAAADALAKALEKEKADACVAAEALTTAAGKRAAEAEARAAEELRQAQLQVEQLQSEKEALAAHHTASAKEKAELESRRTSLLGKMSTATLREKQLQLDLQRAQDVRDREARRRETAAERQDHDMCALVVSSLTSAAFSRAVARSVSAQRATGEGGVAARVQELEAALAARDREIAGFKQASAERQAEVRELYRTLAFHAVDQAMANVVYSEGVQMELLGALTPAAFNPEI